VPPTAERLTWVGHATVLLELGGARLLTDPLLRSHLGYLRRHGAAPAAEVTERLDAVLVSHLHLDHLDVPSLKRIDRAARLLVPRGAASMLRRLGFGAVDELEPGDRVEVGGAEVTAVPAVHDGRRGPHSRAQAVALGFEVAGARRVYFAGDTDLFDEMGELAERLDVALLPVWGWGPTLGPGHMDPLGAARAAALMRPRIAVPIHWGTFFPTGLAGVRGRALVEPPKAFERCVAELAPSVQVRVLAPGQVMMLESVAA
jgi:L-ascorbate metabolism protein UlaG (beta-lactamase superfamily)